MFYTIIALQTNKIINDQYINPVNADKRFATIFIVSPWYRSVKY